MTTFYDARFAPHAATSRAVFRVAQIVRSDGEFVYEAFAPGVFRGWGARDIAVLLDHDPRQRAGTVTSLTAHGDWWIASFVLDGPHAARGADWIARCGKVSPGFDPEEIDPSFAKPISDHHYPTHWHTRAKINEISLLPVGAIPWFAGAKVTRAYESKATPTASSYATTTARRHHAEPEGEVIYGGPTLIRRGIGQVLRVR